MNKTSTHARASGRAQNQEVRSTKLTVATATHRENSALFVVNRQTRPIVGSLSVTFCMHAIGMPVLAGRDDDLVEQDCG